MAPKTRYARNGEANIAYQVSGEGQADLLVIPGLVSHLEMDWLDPDDARYLRRLGSFCRLIRMDKRGTGLSDPVTSTPTLEERVSDMLAVLDAAESERAFVMGLSEGGPASVLFAAMHPERVRGLLLYGTFIKGTELPPEVSEILDRAIADWGAGHIIDLLGPSQARNEVIRRQIGTFERSSASPGMARALKEALEEIDVEAILPTVEVPSLVLHRRDEIIPVEMAARAADALPNGTFVELQGADHWPTLGDSAAVVREIERFVTGTTGSSLVERSLASVVFLDIVQSTARAAALGDESWRSLLEQHDRAVRDSIRAHGGRWIKSLGDGHLAVFDGPAASLAFAQDVRDQVRQFDLELRIGVHAGECERSEGDISGLAVHIGARVNSEAEPGEILVTSTVVDLVVGSRFRFMERGEHELKGVPGTWRLFAVLDRADDGTFDGTRNLRLGDRVLLQLAKRAPSVPRAAASLAAVLERRRASRGDGP